MQFCTPKKEKLKSRTVYIWSPMHTPTTALLCVLPLLSFASAFLFSLFTYFVVCLIVFILFSFQLPFLAFLFIPFHQCSFNITTILIARRWFSLFLLNCESCEYIYIYILYVVTCWDNMRQWSDYLACLSSIPMFFPLYI